MCMYSVASVVTNSVRPHRQQPIRLPRPWDSPGKNTGVLSMGILQQEYWCGLPCPSPGNLPNPRIKPRTPTLQVDSLCLRYQGSLGYLHIMFIDENDLLFLFSYCLCWVLISKLCTEWVKECFLFVHGLEEFV